MKKSFWISMAVIILLLSGFCLLFFLVYPSQNTRKPYQVWNAAMQLEYANTLMAKGLGNQAAWAYEAYLEKNHADKKELAGICYKLGNIYLDLEEYELALRSFYKAELLDAHADYQVQMNQHVVEALENLGLSRQAQYELESRTSAVPAEKKAEPIAAKIGKREITQREIDAAIERLPEWMRNEVKTEEGKVKFIRDFVAGEALYEKAQKLGMDKSAQVKETLASIKKELVLQELIKREVRNNLKISPEDLELYYKANKDKYASLGRIKVSYLEVSPDDKDEQAVSALKSGKGTRIEEWLEENSAVIPVLGEAKEAVASLFNAGKGNISGPLKIKDKTYLFIIDDFQPKKDFSFAEVKTQVENEYTLQKQQEIISTLLQKILEQKEVEIFSQPDNKDAQVKK